MVISAGLENIVESNYFVKEAGDERACKRFASLIKEANSASQSFMDEEPYWDDNHAVIVANDPNMIEALELTQEATYNTLKDRLIDYCDIYGDEIIDTHFARVRSKNSITYSDGIYQIHHASETLSFLEDLPRNIGHYNPYHFDNLISGKLSYEDFTAEVDKYLWRLDGWYHSDNGYGVESFLDELKENYPKEKKLEIEPKEIDETEMEM